MPHRSRAHIGIGIGLIAIGTLLALAFADVETPVIGLRQVGVVLIVIGVGDIVFALVRRRNEG